MGVGAASHTTVRRYAAHFTSVGAALHTTARVNAAPFSAVVLGVLLPILLRLAYVLSFTADRVDAAFFNAVGVDAYFIYCS